MRAKNGEVVIVDIFASFNVQTPSHRDFFCMWLTFELKDFVVQLQSAFGSGRVGLNLRDVDSTVRIARGGFCIILVYSTTKLQVVGKQKRILQVLATRTRAKTKKREKKHTQTDKYHTKHLNITQNI